MEYLKNMQIVLNNTKKIFKPPPDLKISEWADSYRRLSPENSAEAGQWSTTRAEYQREIMDSFNDPKIQRIVVMTSSQVGKTELLLNAIAYYMDQDPSPMLCVQPTLAMAQSFSKDRLAAMIRDTHKIKNLVAESKSRDSGNTVLHKRFPGGHLSLAGSNSAAGLASRAIRVLLLDETDRYELSAGAEGSPIALSIARTKTFPNRKIYMCSTPTIKGISAIEAAFEESDKRYFLVPCPECGHKQQLKWKGVVWDEDKPETAHYVCEDCGSVINESKKPWMLKHGEWQATAKSIDTAGFHLSELYSPWSTWATMARNFLEAKKMPETLKTFVNTSLAESWEDRGDGVEHDSLLTRRLNYDPLSLPEDILVATCAVDCQKDRLEAMAMGWSHNYKAYVIEHKVFWGDPNAAQVWQELDQYLRTRFKTESGRAIPISSTCIDSGGLATQSVYSFTKTRQGRRIFAIKGASVQGKPIVSKPTYVGKLKNVLYTVGTDTAKDNIYARLNAPEEDATLFFPADVDEEFFKQLTAEKRITKWVRGRKSLVWKQIRPRNEILDLTVYNFAAIYILNPNFDLIEEKLLTGVQEDPTKQQNNKNRSNLRNKSNFATSWKN